MIHDLLLEPRPLPRVETDRGGDFAGRSMAAWRGEARSRLGVDEVAAVVATGHQTLLWHPGILTKYLLVEAWRRLDPGISVCQLVVDQHTGGFGRMDVPLRDEGGGLQLATLLLTEDRDGVPMGWHPSFHPPPLPALSWATPAVAIGVKHIHAAIAAASEMPNAALQMAAALDQLMKPWVDTMVRVTASGLMTTPFARALVERMVEDPRGCVTAYNDAAVAAPEAGVATLAIGRERVELPLWYRGPDDRRIRATDGEARAWLDDPDETPLLPRALLLTGLVRLVMCDVFVHGTGGATYDRVMERWLESWLGLAVAPIVEVTATVRLPLGDPPPADDIVDAARHVVRRFRHDPDAAPLTGPSSGKSARIAAIDAAPRRSSDRAVAFRDLHAWLEERRDNHRDASNTADDRLAELQRTLAAAPITRRRTWPFPLYDTETIDDLARVVGEAIEQARPRPGGG